MQASSIPTKIQVPFAASGAKNVIPVTAPAGAAPNAASFTAGFPAVTFTPLAAGGLPPFGQDFNGAFNIATAWIQWINAGGPSALYDAAFQTAVGGYPAGAVVASAVTFGCLWISTIDNNVTNPDTGGVGWLRYDSGRKLVAYTYEIAGSYTWTCPANVTVVSRVRIIGGGGGGSQCHTITGGGGATSGGGGGGGGYAESVGVGVTPGTAYTLIVGTGGGSQTNGGTSSGFGLSATGGSGSGFYIPTLNCAGGGGGVGSGGNVANLMGSWGTDGQSGTFCFAGDGAPGWLGMGKGRAGNGAGSAGTSPGAGGGGAYDSAATAILCFGGAGAAGAVLFEYYNPS